jgi:hypothetical protein
MSDSTPESESIRARLLKVLRLSQQGVGGERENAEALLEKLLRKHSMTMADLESFGAAESRVWLSASDAEERIVLSQLAIRLFGTKRKLWTQQGKFEVGLDASPSEKAAIQIAWEVYREAFSEARHALVLGFCFKHDLYASEENGNTEMSDEERERGRRAMALADVLPKVDAPGRRLGSG